MPVYSLVALILSLFGASYTAISTLKNHFDFKIRSIHEGVDRKMAVINEGLDEDTLKKAAKGYANGISRGFLIWRYSNIVPIILFITVVFLIGIGCLFCWNLVIQPTALSQYPDLHNPSLATAAVQTTTYTPDPTPYLVTCRAGWWVLLITIVVNGACTIGAWLSKNTISGHGKHLGELHLAAEKALANKSLGTSSLTSSTSTTG